MWALHEASMKDCIGHAGMVSDVLESSGGLQMAFV